MECILLGAWLVCGLIGAIICEQKGRNSAGGLLLGVFFGPIGVIICAVLEKNERVLEKRTLRSGEMRKCPYCAEPLRWEASVCRYCGREVSPSSLLAEGISLSKSGHKPEARRILEQIVRQERNNEKAWLWLSGAVETDRERQRCLGQVLRINPNNVDAQTGLEVLRQRAAQRTKMPTPASKAGKAINIVIISLLVFVSLCWGAIGLYELAAWFAYPYAANATKVGLLGVWSLVTSAISLLFIWPVIQRRFASEALLGLAAIAALSGVGQLAVVPGTWLQLLLLPLYAILPVLAYVGRSEST